jgi:hypothetical protein
VHVAEEVNQELQGFIRQLVSPVRPASSYPSTSLGLDPLFQIRCDIPDCTKNVYALPTGPATLTREQTSIGRMVTKSADIVQGGRPSHAIADLVCPGSDGGEVATRGTRIRGGEIQDITEGGEDTRVEVYLCDRRDYFVS